MVVLTVFTIVAVERKIIQVPVSLSVWAALTKTPYPGWLRHQIFLPHSSRGWGVQDGGSGKCVLVKDLFPGA